MEFSRKRIIHLKTPIMGDDGVQVSVIECNFIVVKDGYIRYGDEDIQYVTEFGEIVPIDNILATTIKNV